MRRSFARSIAAGGSPPTSALSGAQRRALDALLGGDGSRLDLACRARLPVGHAARQRPRRQPDPAARCWSTMRSRSTIRRSTRWAEQPVSSAVAFVSSFVSTRARRCPLLRCAGARRRCDARSARPRSAPRSWPLGRRTVKFSTEAAKRWARRGKFLPLGIGEALAEGSRPASSRGPRCCGSAHRGAGLRMCTPRAETSGLPGALRSRAGQASAPAVAVLGVRSDAPLVYDLLASVSGLDPSPAHRRARADRLVAAKPTALIALPSRTHREVVLAEMAKTTRSYRGTRRLRRGREARAVTGERRSCSARGSLRQPRRARWRWRSSPRRASRDARSRCSDRSAPCVRGRLVRRHRADQPTVPAFTVSISWIERCVPAAIARARPSSGGHRGPRQRRDERRHWRCCGQASPHSSVIASAPARARRSPTGLLSPLRDAGRSAYCGARSSRRARTKAAEPPRCKGLSPAFWPAFPRSFGHPRSGRSEWQRVAADAERMPSVGFGDQNLGGLAIRAGAVAVFLFRFLDLSRISATAS